MSLSSSSPPRYAGPPAVPGYVLGEFLGRGSSAVVWSATREGATEQVAVKVVSADSPDRFSGVLAASDRERALGRAISSTHLVRARDRVVLPDEQVALVLDLADGGTLRDVVTIRGALPLGELVTALTPLASALAELHAAGIVHADLAPGNVLFTTDGRPMLADLASARLVDDDPWPDDVLGTPGFVAPEVTGGGSPGPASDVWSLGALAWFARTGGSSPPGSVGDLHWNAGAAREDGSPTVDDVVAAVGPELRPVLVRMLADDPSARPTAAEAALALYRVAAPERVGLVGHHPDPAAAVTHRIRRQAAETRSRSQLRDQARAEHRRAARQRRRAGVTRVLHPRAWRRDGTAGAAPGSLTRGAAVGAAGPAGVAGAGGSMGATGAVKAAVPVRPARSVKTARPAGAAGMAGSARSAGTEDAAVLAHRSNPGRRSTGTRTVQLRLAVVALLAAALAGGMLALLRVDPGTSLVSARVSEPSERPSPQAPDPGPGAAASPGDRAPSAASVASAPEPAGGAGSESDIPSGGSSDPQETETDTPSSGPQTASGNVAADAAAARSVDPSPTPQPELVVNPGRDPAGALQRVADLRAGALVAADPVALLRAEPAGSAAYRVDAEAVSRLRDQRQRYTGLSFVVRETMLEQHDERSAVVRAVVDRSGYSVVSEDGSTQTVAAAPGQSLRYTLTATDTGWLLTEVASG